jgi:hypothetical protein
MSDDEAAARAAELAERILDEVSSADQDWRSVSRWAEQLAELADGMAAVAGDPEGRCTAR